jgi:hypothetical protein
MTFAALSCNTDITNVRTVIDNYVTQAMIDTHIDEFKQIHNFIDEYHTVTELALSRHAVVDTRVGLGDHGIYQEPLERVRLYLGLSMKKDQTVNASIDGKSGVKRALIPGHPTNANLWFELYQRITNCASCSALLTATHKKCPCDAARYCNKSCLAKHHKAHMPVHKTAMAAKRKQKKAAQERKKKK